jgi:competence protein ComEC
MTPSKILFYFCISSILGIFLNSLINISQPVLLGFLILAVFLIFILWKHRKLVVIGFCLIFLVLGIWKHQAAEVKISESELRNFNDKSGSIILIGIIDEEPILKEKSQNFDLETETLEFGGKILKISGKVLVTVTRYPEYKYGDKLKITGQLKTPEKLEGFNYKDYLAKDGIYSVMAFPKIEKIDENYGNSVIKTLISFKNKLKESLNRVIPQPHSAFLEALLFGEEQNISKEWKDKLNLTGTRHLTAVSGMNITIISAILLNFLLILGLWRNQAFYFSVIILILYILMIGAPASVVRAGIMAILFLIGQHFGRLSSASRAIIIAAAFMLFQNPLLLRLDVGFQLSFLGVMGLIYLQPIFSDLFKKIPNFLQLRNNLAATISAQIFTFPILIYNFGRITILSPISNILILPLIPLVTILGFIFAFIGIFFQSLAQILSWSAYLMLNYITKIIDFFSKISWSNFTFKNVPWIFVVLFYSILVLLTVWLQRRKKLKFLDY